MRRLLWRVFVSAACFGGSALAAGCGLAECTDDPTTVEDECAAVIIQPGDGENTSVDTAASSEEDGEDLQCDAECPDDPGGDCADASNSESACNGETDLLAGVDESEDTEEAGSGVSCDSEVGLCDAQEGTVDACPEDPDCDGGLSSPCQADGYCDLKCAEDSDPDCAE